MIVPPPVSAGGVNVTVKADDPKGDVPMTFVGAPGSPIGIMTLLAMDFGPVPMALVAETVNV